MRKNVGLGVGLVTLAAVAGLAYRSIDAALETLGWVEHASEVVQQLETVSSTYARATSARRAYIVAGDPSQLDDRPALDATLARAVATVRESVADNPAQVRRLDGLDALLRARLRDLDGTVEDRRRGSPRTETAEGLALVTRIREAREEMEREETRLLTERDARTRADISETKTAIVVGTLGSVAILLLAFRLVRNENRRRRVSEAFLDSIVENLPTMVFVKEASELRFERINRAGEALLGLDRAALLGKNDYDFFPPEQADFFQSRDRETLAAGAVVDIAEEPIETKGGERWLHTMKVPILDENGQPKHLLGISEDITERRRNAQALRSAKDAAEAANQELESFSYSVAHDLRAPLRAIDGFSQALEEDCAGKLGPNETGHLRRVRASAKHMGELIDGLLGLSRLSRSALACERVDLSRLAERCVGRLREAQPARQVDVAIEPGLAAEGDPNLLGAVLDNLLANAWKFTSKREAARIELGKRTENGQTVFFVRDNGAGFDPAYRAKLFGAFQRLHSVKEFDGTGIGLATVQRIVRRHGGRAWAEGAVGHGATFYFTLRPQKENARG